MSEQWFGPSADESLANIGAELELIATELKRANDARDDFYREVVSTLKTLRDAEDPQPVPVSPGPCPSGLPGWSGRPGVHTVIGCGLRAGHTGLHEAASGSTWDDDTAIALKAAYGTHEGEGNP